MNLKFVPVRLEPDLVDLLDGQAVKRGTSRASIIREGLRFFIARHVILADVELRRVEADEFIYMALDHIIRAKHHNVYQGMLEEAARRARALRD